ncbi:MAG: hypothetical protein ACM3QX_18225 [Syntrophomonadaceae bacterium]
MPELNPLIGRSMYEYFFGMYGNDQRAQSGVSEIKNYLNNMGPGASQTYQKALGGLKALLTNQSQNGLPELQTLKNQAAQKLERTTAKNVQTMRENIDPTLLKTMGSSAFNDIYANEETAQADNEANFTRLNMASKENAISQLLGIAQTETNAVNADRNFDMNMQFGMGNMAEGSRQYNSQADIQGQFNWGSAIGGLLQGAGSLLGGIL